MKHPGGQKSDRQKFEELIRQSDKEALYQFANDRAEKKLQPLPFVQRQFQVFKLITQNIQALPSDEFFNINRITYLAILTLAVYYPLRQTNSGPFIALEVSALLPIIATWMISRRKAWLGLKPVLSYGYLASVLILGIPMVFLAFINTPYALISCLLLISALVALNLYQFTGLSCHYLRKTLKPQAS